MSLSFFLSVWFLVDVDLADRFAELLPPQEPPIVDLDLALAAERRAPERTCLPIALGSMSPVLGFGY